ncbi:MAG: hypothetical protein KDA48_07110, partial [Amphiplicatus sp.]|nr:hypothetical protein [Amphiplicatus sp.]
MAVLKIYSLKTCDTCRKAIKALEGAGADLKIVDVRTDGVTKKQIEVWAKAVGWEKLLNKSSTTWRGLDDSDKEGVNEKRAVALMAVHPTLIKRPVIEANGE